MDLIDCDLSSNQASSEGGAIWVDSDVSELAVIDSTFTNNTSPSGGAIGVQSPFFSTTQIVIQGSTFNANSADYGGALSTSGTRVEIRDSQFTDNTGSVSGGALDLDGLPYLRLRRNVFCGNDGGFFGGAVATRVYEALNQTYSHVIHHNTFQHNEATSGGGLFAVTETYWPLDRYQIAIASNTFVANTADNGSHVYAHDEVEPLARNNILALGEGAGPGWEQTGNGTYGDQNYNLWYSNAGGNSVGAPGGANDVFGNPLFVSYSNDGVCNDNFGLALGSPAVDAGDPGSPPFLPGWPPYNDGDGSRADIGMTGAR